MNDYLNSLLLWSLENCTVPRWFVVLLILAFTVQTARAAGSAGKQSAAEKRIQGANEYADECREDTVAARKELKTLQDEVIEQLQGHRDTLCDDLKTMDDRQMKVIDTLMKIVEQQCGVSSVIKTSFSETGIKE